MKEFHAPRTRTAEKKFIFFSTLRAPEITEEWPQELPREPPLRGRSTEADEKEAAVTRKTTEEAAAKIAAPKKAEEQDAAKIADEAEEPNAAKTVPKERAKEEEPRLSCGTRGQPATIW